MNAEPAFQAIQPRSIDSTTDGLISFQFYPQPVFLLSKDMNLVSTNSQGEEAIRKHWIGLSANKLHFNCRDNDSYVKTLVDRLLTGTSSSERFVIRCIDTVFRAYTLSFEPVSFRLILTIQGDITNDDNRLEVLSKAFSLTTSESKILNLMVDGLKPKEIGYEAGISLSTVRSHLRTLYAKMNVRNYNDALKQAVRLLV